MDSLETLTEHLMRFVAYINDVLDAFQVSINTHVTSKCVCHWFVSRNDWRVFLCLFWWWYLTRGLINPFFHKALKVGSVAFWERASASLFMLSAKHENYGYHCYRLWYDAALSLYYKVKMCPNINVQFYIKTCNLDREKWETFILNQFV